MCFGNTDSFIISAFENRNSYPACILFAGFASVFSINYSFRGEKIAHIYTHTDMLKHSVVHFFLWRNVLRQMISTRIIRKKEDASGTSGNGHKGGHVVERRSSCSSNAVNLFSMSFRGRCFSLDATENTKNVFAWEVCDYSYLFTKPLCLVSFILH